MSAVPWDTLETVPWFMMPTIFATISYQLPFKLLFPPLSIGNIPPSFPPIWIWLAGCQMWCQEPTADWQEYLIGIQTCRKKDMEGGNTAAGMFRCHSLLLESVPHSRCLSRWHWEVSWKASIAPFLGPLQPSIQPLIHPSSSLHPLTRRCE